MTWGFNLKKNDSDKKNGIDNRISKSVCQYDLNGIFIKGYYSIQQASRETGFKTSGIINTCLGNNKNCNGYIFRYKDDEFDKYDIANIRLSNNSNILRLSLDMVILKEYSNRNEIENDGFFCHCCRGRTKTHKGFKWMYKDNYEEMLELGMTHKEYMKYKYNK